MGSFGTVVYISLDLSFFSHILVISLHGLENCLCYLPHLTFRCLLGVAAAALSIKMHPFSGAVQLGALISSPAA